MSTATQNLENDHVYILQLTDVMAAMVMQQSTNIEDFESVVNLIRKFADGFHHAKEENLLFPKMGEKGYSSQQGPVAVMLHEHMQGRAYVKGMSEAIEKLRNGDTAAITDVYQNMAGYASLLQNHISKENNILFRMVNQVLSQEEQESLLSQFAEVEKQVDTEYNSENSIAKIALLASVYL